MEKLNPTLYQLEILRLLNNRNYLYTADIEEKLKARGIEKNMRTLQRDLKKLAEHFEGEIEVDTRTHHYGYRWKKGALGLNLPTLSPQQAAVLKLVEQQLRHLLPANILAEMTPFFKQAHYQLEYDNQARSVKLAKQWQRKIAVTPTSQPLEAPEINNDIFQAISTALYENRYLNVEYQSQWKPEVSRYQIMPLGLVQQGVRYYLVAQKIENDKPVYEPFFLVLHRFKQAELSTFHFEYPKEFDLRKMVTQDKRFGFGDCIPIQLRFSITHSAGFHLTETPLERNQTILEETPKYYRFQVNTIKTQMLEKWLLGFGEDVWDVEMIEIEN